MTDRLEELLDGQWEDEEQSGSQHPPRPGLGRARTKSRRAIRGDTEGAQAPSPAMEGDGAGRGDDGDGAERSAAAGPIPLPGGDRRGPWETGGRRGGRQESAPLGRDGPSALDGAWPGTAHSDEVQEREAPGMADETWAWEETGGRAALPGGERDRPARDMQTDGGNGRRGRVLADGLRQLGRAAARVAGGGVYAQGDRTRPGPAAVPWQEGGEGTARAVDRAFERDARRYDGRFSFH